MLGRLKELGYEILFLSHAAAILGEDFPDALDELETSLAAFDIPITEIIGSGGGETKGTQRLRHSLAARGWKKTNFEIKKSINGVERESISHEVDHVRQFDNGVVALEIEWNNKDPFFDRDLENFKRLHAEGAISVGVIITRGTTLQDDARDMVTRFVRERNILSYDDLKLIGLEPTAKQMKAVMKCVSRAKKPLPFQEAWTRNSCPLLLIGMPSSIVTFDPAATIEMLEEPDAEESDEAGI